MEPVKFFDAVYVIPSSSEVEMANQAPSFWQKYFINSAEFVFNFGQASTVTPDGLNERHITHPIEEMSTAWRVCQGISLIAVTILFPVGFFLLGVKAFHHDDLGEKLASRIGVLTDPSEAMREKEKYENGINPLITIIENEKVEKGEEEVSNHVDEVDRSDDVEESNHSEESELSDDEKITNLLEEAKHDRGLSSLMQNSYSPLDAAMYLNKIDCIDILLNQKCVDEYYIGVGNLLHKAILFKRSNLIEELLSDKYSEFNVSKMIEGKGRNGATPLCYAAFKGDIKAVEILTEKGADLDASDRDGKSAIHYAAAGNHHKIFEFLAQEGCNYVVF